VPCQKGKYGLGGMQACQDCEAGTYSVGGTYAHLLAARILAPALTDPDGRIVFISMYVFQSYLPRAPSARRASMPWSRVRQPVERVRMARRRKET